MEFLSDDQMFFINQSESTRKILKTEKENEAREREYERLRQVEFQWAASQKVANNKLRNEWRTIGEGKRARHERTGRFVLGGEVVADGDRITIRHAGEPVTVSVRYTYVGATREIKGAYGDSEGREPVALAQGMRAQFAEPEVEVEPEGWYVHYDSGTRQWQTIKGALVAGTFPEAADASDLADVLNSFEATKKRDADSVHYRRP